MERQLLDVSGLAIPLHTEARGSGLSLAPCPSSPSLPSNVQSDDAGEENEERRRIGPVGDTKYL